MDASQILPYSRDRFAVLSDSDASEASDDDDNDAENKNASAAGQRHQQPPLLPPPPCDMASIVLEWDLGRGNNEWAEPPDDFDLDEDPTMFGSWQDPVAANTMPVVPAAKPPTLLDHAHGYDDPWHEEEDIDAQLAFEQELLMESEFGSTAAAPATADRQHQRRPSSHPPPPPPAMDLQMGQETQYQPTMHMAIDSLPAGPTSGGGARQFRALPPFGTLYTGSTTADGTRLYFPHRATAVDNDAQIPPPQLEKALGGTLGDAIYPMVRDIEAGIALGLLPSLDPATGTAINVPVATTPQPESAKSKRRRAKAAAAGERLWVDKYAPVSYLDLVGDEGVARSVLAWVRSWDTCVYGTKPSADLLKSIAARSAMAAQARFGGGGGPRSGEGIPRGLSGKPGGPGGTGAPAPGGPRTGLYEPPVDWASLAAVERTPNDPLYRPAKRILVLAGPPGLGKTTLAHVIAKAAGYDVTEINASDERTARAVGMRIENAMTGATIAPGGKVSTRPRLVIVDEIDGAADDAGGLVRMLVGMAEVGRFIKKGAAASSSGDKAIGPPALRRPIICICNDLYAPALRPLRAIARIVQVRRPESHFSLVRRLSAIAKNEGIRVSTQALHWLAVAADGDLRSCIHALQYAAVVTAEQLAAAAADGIQGSVSSSTLAKSLFISREVLERAATKDAGPKSLPSVWETVFSPRAGDALAVRSAAESGEAAVVSRGAASAVAEMISRSGEYDKIIVGIHEYLVRARVAGGDFSRISQAYEALIASDRLVAAGYRPGFGGHGDQVHRYVPWAVAGVHTSFRGGLAAGSSALDSERLEFPHVDYDAFLARRAVEQVISTFRRPGLDAGPQRSKNANSSAVSLGGTTMAGLSSARLAMDVFSGPIARILSPPAMRHANWLLMPAAEKKRVDSLVAAMRGLGIKMISDQTSDVAKHRFEPPIDLACGLAVRHGKVKIVPASYAVRQLIATQMETSAIRLSSSESLQAKVAREQSSSKERDFFGRPIHRPVLAVSQEPRASGAPNLMLHRVRYKYNDGYSDAMRTTVFMCDLA
ncbi:hypothetical protein BC828DRAFT_398148 [Blastocladiella britannica]|nr:hypothetical protein BC828DRAFT_398148 [Blastocladiella britannica]